MHLRWLPMGKAVAHLHLCECMYACVYGCIEYTSLHMSPLHACLFDCVYHRHVYVRHDVKVILHGIAARPRA